MTSTNTEKPQLRAACYLRISSDPDDKRQGVDRQREDCTALCEAKGWRPEGFYVDNDKSASNGKGRPEWDRLLADVKAGSIDAIVVWNQDRGWRQMSQLEDLRRFFESLGRRIELTTTLIGDIDLYDPYGVYAAQNRTAASELETAVMKIRMRRAARQKAEQGRPQWKRAFGYLDDTYQLNPKTAPLVKEAYASILAGSSLGDIAGIFNDAGAHGLTGQPWTASTVSLFLRKPRNAGLRSHNDEIVGKGTWPPLVDESTWRAAQDVLNAPGRKPGRKSVRQHPLTGVMRCGREGCDGHLAGNWCMQPTGGQPGRLKAGETRAVSAQVKHSITYSCRKCHRVSVRAEHVVPLLYALIGGRLAKPDAVDLLKAHFHDEREAEAMRAEKSVLYGQIDEANREYDDGVIDGRRLAARTERVNEKLAIIARKERNAERLRVFDGLPLGKHEVVDAVKRLSADRFRAVLSVLCTVTILPVGKGGRVFDPARVTDGIAWK
jgi:DNA invertase Pin-like site-specific DNA recombinase